MSGTSLAMRILDAVPAATHEMTALLGLLRIEESRDVPTAAVSCERQPILRINPDFVAQHCRTDEHLFLLVMHELHHDAASAVMPTRSTPWAEPRWESLNFSTAPNLLSRHNPDLFPSPVGTPGKEKRCWNSS